MSDFPHDIMATASWVAAHRLDLSKEAGQQIVRLIAHSLNDERTKSAARIAALEAENTKLRAALIEASTRMKNARSAVESNQVADKDVHGTLTRGMFEIAEALGE